VHFLDNQSLSDHACHNNAHYSLQRLKGEFGLRDFSMVDVRMNMDDSRLIARFQLLTTEMLIEKRLGQRRPELTDDSIRYGWNLTNAQNEEQMLRP
jgi:hypothetical protein